MTIRTISFTGSGNQVLSTRTSGDTVPTDVAKRKIKSITIGDESGSANLVTMQEYDSGAGSAVEEISYPTAANGGQAIGIDAEEPIFEADPGYQLRFTVGGACKIKIRFEDER